MTDGDETRSLLEWMRRRARIREDRPPAVNILAAVTPPLVRRPFVFCIWHPIPTEMATTAKPLSPLPPSPFEREKSSSPRRPPLPHVSIHLAERASERAIKHTKIGRRLDRPSIVRSPHLASSQLEFSTLLPRGCGGGVVVVVESDHRRTRSST